MGHVPNMVSDVSKVEFVVAQRGINCGEDFSPFNKSKWTSK